MANNWTFSCFVNVSDDSLTEIAWIVLQEELEFDTPGNGYAAAAIVLLLFIIGVPWNLFVTCAIVKKKLYTQPVVMLMLNLTITNLLVCILIMPFNIVSGIAGEYIFGESDLVRCRVCQTGIMAIILPWISIHTLCLMSIDRFIYLKRPLKYSRIVTPKCMLAIIIVVWILCTLIALPPLFGFGEIRFSYTVANCVPYVVGETHIAPNFIYNLIIFVEIMVPVLLVFTMYIWILCIIRSSLVRRFKRATETQGNKERASKEHVSSQLQLVKLFGAIFTANIVTWLPMISLVLTGAARGVGRVHPLFYSISYLSYLSQTVVHPILESCLLREIKQILSEVLKFVRSVLGLHNVYRGSKATDSSVAAVDSNSGTAVEISETKLRDEPV